VSVVGSGARVKAASASGVGLGGNAAKTRVEGVPIGVVRSRAASVSRVGFGGDAL